MELSARPLSLEDANLILRWRNSPEVRSMSKNQSKITEIEHRAWMKSWLSEENRGFFWIYSGAEEDLGYVRFDLLIEPKEFEVSIVIANSMRGQGIGKMMLADSLIRLASQSDVSSIRAVVHSSNTASMKLFASTGFRKVESSQDWVEFKL